MSNFFTDYHEAREAAQKLADSCHMNAIIRKGKQYSTNGYYVHLECQNDAKFEVVTPRE